MKFKNSESHAILCFITAVIAAVFLLSCAHSNSRPDDTADYDETVSDEHDDKSDLVGEDNGEADEDVSPEDAEIDEEADLVADPLGGFNRAMFVFNDKLYFWFMKPVAQGYSTVVPEWVRVRVRSFFNNLKMPITAVNSFLQLKVRAAFIDIGRFVYNSTMGIGGLFDFATLIDLRSSEEDFGQTLGFYGIGNGFYIVWPFLGPSTLRDTFGFAGDTVLYPVDYLRPVEAAVGARVSEEINETSLTIGDYEDLKASAIDPYIALRNAYIQHRNSKIEE